MGLIFHCFWKKILFLRAHTDLLDRSLLNVCNVLYHVSFLQTPSKKKGTIRDKPIKIKGQKSTSKWCGRRAKFFRLPFVTYFNCSFFVRRWPPNILFLGRTKLRVNGCHRITYSCFHDFLFLQPIVEVYFTANRCKLSSSIVLSLWPSSGPFIYRCRCLHIQLAVFRV